MPKKGDIDDGEDDFTYNPEDDEINEEEDNGK